MRIKEPVCGDGKCSLCGGVAGAEWHGKANTVSICRQCALTDLPRLIADVLVGVGGDKTYDSAAHFLPQIEAAYWRAVAAAASTQDPDGRRLR